MEIFIWIFNSRISGLFCVKAIFDIELWCDGTDGFGLVAAQLFFLEAIQAAILLIVHKKDFHKLPSFFRIIDISI